jgi:hypothetical protein
MKRRTLIILVFWVQSLCAAFFVSDILSSVLGLRRTPMNWQLLEGPLTQP